MIVLFHSGSVRAKGYTPPLSVLQIRAQLCEKYSWMSRVMLAMLTPKHVSNNYTTHYLGNI